MSRQVVPRHLPFVALGVTPPPLRSSARRGASQPIPSRHLEEVSPDCRKASINIDDSDGGQGRRRSVDLSFSDRPFPRPDLGRSVGKSARDPLRGIGDY